MRYLAAVVCVLIVGLLLSATGLAQSFRSTPTKAILYKNGLGWVTEEGRGEHESDAVSTMLHGIPVVGSLRVVPAGDVTVMEIKSDPGLGGQSATTIDALQEVAKGQTLFVLVGDRSISGKMLGISYSLTGHEPMLMLEQKDGTVMIPLKSVEKLETRATSQDISPWKRTEKPVLRMRLSQKEGEFHINSSYLTRNLGWTPTYQLDMGDEDGHLTMSAVVVNNSLDLASVDVQFATGEAAFPLRWMDSPLFAPGTSPEQVMDAVMGNADMGYMNDIDNNPVYNQMNYVPAQQMISPNPGVAVTRSSGEETHLYGPIKLTLASGERAIVPVGSGKVPAKFVYYWKIPQAVDANTGKNSVWLAAKVVNKLGFPLTTGAMLVTRKERPVGQGFVTYTHEGGEALVPISISSSVLASAGEREADRDKSAVSFRGGSYDRVTVRGTLTVENLQERPVTMRIEKAIHGKVVKASNNAKWSQQFVSAYDPNPTSAINWDLKLKAGDKLEVSYRYQFLVERHSNSAW